MAHLSSMFIDNELNLDEKIQFIDGIRFQPVFYEDTRALLHQEKLLRMPPPPARLPARAPGTLKAASFLPSQFRPLVYAAAGFAAAGLLLFALISPTNAPPAWDNRFVIYEPSAQRVELTGSFTDWQRTPLRPVGNSGYWELTLPVSIGEHRFAYILDGTRQMADPTILRREKDDFGGENSILSVEARI